MDYYATHTRQFPRLKRFDLKVGDTVKHHGVYYEWTPNGRESKVKTTRIYKVIHISNHVFLVENKEGIKTSFMKKEYQLGEVEKV